MNIYVVSICASEEDNGEVEWLVKARNEAEALELAATDPEFAHHAEKAKTKYSTPHEPTVELLLGRGDRVRRI